MATEARYGWELPDLADVADAPGAFLEFANDVSDTIADSIYTSYTPVWVSDVGNNPINPSARVGLYKMRNKIVDFYVAISFGASTLGGSGALEVGLPTAANSGFAQQIANCMLWTPGAGVVWNGPGTIDSSTAFSRVRPHFPIDATRSDMAPWASTAGLAGLSIPNLPGSSIQNGGRIIVQGSYFAA